MGSSGVTLVWGLQKTGNVDLESIGGLGQKGRKKLGGVGLPCLKKKTGWILITWKH